MNMDLISRLDAAISREVAEELTDLLMETRRELLVCTVSHQLLAARDRATHVALHEIVDTLLAHRPNPVPARKRGFGNDLHNAVELAVSKLREEMAERERAAAAVQMAADRRDERAAAEDPTRVEVMPRHFDWIQGPPTDGSVGWIDAKLSFSPGDTYRMNWHPEERKWITLSGLTACDSECIDCYRFVPEEEGPEAPGPVVEDEHLALLEMVAGPPSELYRGVIVARVETNPGLHVLARDIHEPELWISADRGVAVLSKGIVSFRKATLLERDRYTLEWKRADAVRVDEAQAVRVQEGAVQAAPAPKPKSRPTRSDLSWRTGKPPANAGSYLVVREDKGAGQMETHRVRRDRGGRMRTAEGRLVSARHILRWREALPQEIEALDRDVAAKPKRKSA